jgi:hypothetical protein
VTEILEPVTLFASSRRERQHRIEPVEGLDGGLFVQAEDGGFGRLDRPRTEMQLVRSPPIRGKLSAGLNHVSPRLNLARLNIAMFRWPGVTVVPGSQVGSG